MARFLCLTLVVLVVVACSDPQSEANRLAVEAKGLVERARAEPDVGKRIDLLNRALADLDRIIEVYPESDLAVILAGGGAVAGISRADIVAAIDRAEGARLKDDPQPGAIIGRAIALIERYYDRGPQVPIERLTLNKQSYRASAAGLLALSEAMAGRDQSARARFEEAVRDARNAPVPGLERAFVLGNLASYQATAGYHDAARQTYEAAYAVVRDGLDPPWRFNTLLLIAGSLRRSGDPANALPDFLRVVESMAPEGTKAEQISTLALAVEVLLEFKAGDLAERLAQRARAAVEKIESESDKVSALVEIADIDIALGDMAAARRAVVAAADLSRRIDSDFERQSARRTVALAWIKLGDFEDARRAISNMPAGFNKAWATNALVRGLAEAGDLSAARDVMATLDRTEIKDGTRVSMALQEMQANRFEAARSEIDAIEDRFNRVAAWIDLASELREREDQDGAARATERAIMEVDALAQTNQRDEIRSRIISGLISAERLREALAMVERIESPWEQAVTLMDIASVQLQARAKAVADPTGAADTTR